MKYAEHERCETCVTEDTHSKVRPLGSNIRRAFPDDCKPPQLCSNSTGEACAMQQLRYNGDGGYAASPG